MAAVDLKPYLSTRRVLIAVSGQGNARAIRKLVMQMGAKPDAVFIAESFKQAKNELEAAPTAILFAEVNLKEEGGLALVPIQEKSFNSRLDVVTILVGGDPSPSTLGAITDSNIDSVLLQPFTVQTFTEALQQAVVPKLNPSPYLKALDEGKQLMKAEKYDEALAVFEKCISMDAKPELSHYYVGQVRAAKDQLPMAIAAYHAGLKSDPKHFNCLSGLFQALIKSTEYQQAYDLAQRIHKDYPVSPDRILDLVKLSVYVRKYTDIVDYYQIFKDAQAQDPTLSKVVVAGMLICAKYYSINDKKKECLEVLKSASRSALERNVLQLDVFRYYIETGFLSEGEVYYASLPDEVQSLPKGKLIYFDLVSAQGNPSHIFQEGMKLIKAKNTSAKLYQVMIKSLRAEGKNQGTLDSLIAEALQLYPDQSDLFK